MEIIVAVWLVFGAFILGANTGHPDIASAGGEHLIATQEEHRLTEAPPDAPNGESEQDHACSAGHRGVIYRDLTLPHVSTDE
ncbi:MAG: hypothetical protein U9P00_13260 [Pseudomonadota bacterium]|nr:hypothetical protein [Pseudomonadota bacterium]